MPKLRTVVIAGAATILFAGAAVAATAKVQTMQVSLPDGSIASITYTGNVAPRVAIEPADAQAAHADPFAVMERDFARVSAMMEAQDQRAMQEIAAMQQQTVSAKPAKDSIAGTMPRGSSYSYMMVSSSNGQGSCTQTVEWRSDGASEEPKVTRASSGDCGSAKDGEGDKPVPVSVSPKAARVDPRSI
jgi:hypothetical protein